MKKLILVFTSLFIICFVTYRFAITSHSLASNRPYETEYYYNEEDFWDNLIMVDASTSTPVKGSINTRIDTNPESIGVLINKEYGLPEDYVPEDLQIPDIKFSFSGYNEKKLMRQKASEALESLFQSAEEEGLNLYGVSGYRSYVRQLFIYNKNMRKDGLDLTSLYSAKAGHSEHQSGLSIDVSTQSIHNRLDVTFASTPEGRFLAEHAFEFGFVIRYPKDKSEITGYAYEPWHIRYVGVDLARVLTENNLCLEEYYGYSPNSTLQGDTSYGAAIDVEERFEMEEEY
ncbi:MAG: M15 family metallopeptidase [Acetivibrio sp.]